MMLDLDGGVQNNGVLKAKAMVKVSHHEFRLLEVRKTFGIYPDHHQPPPPPGQ